MSPSTAVPPLFGGCFFESSGRKVASGTGNGGEVHPNEALVRSGYDAFIRGDLEAVAGFLHPDVLWHVAGTGPLAGIYKGHAELLEFFAHIAEITDGTISIEARDVLASDDHVIVLTQMRAVRGGRVLDDRGVAMFTIVDGQATEVHMFAEDQDALDGFFA